MQEGECEVWLTERGFVFAPFGGISNPIFVEDEPVTVVEVCVGFGEVVLTQLREFLFSYFFFDNVQIDRMPFFHVAPHRHIS